MTITITITLVKKDTPETPGGDIIATHPSKSSTQCQWDTPSGNKINFKPTKGEEIFFSKTKYTTSKANADKQKHAKQKCKQYEPSLYNKHMKTNENEIRNSFSVICSHFRHFGQMFGHFRHFEPFSAIFAIL